VNSLRMAAALMVGLAPTVTAQSQASWNVDTNHSRVAFTVRHFFTPVQGSFDNYHIALEYDPDAPEQASIMVTIPVSSIDTDHDKRDSDLQGEQFFDAASHPNIEFTSDSVTVLTENQLLVHGTLTIKGVSRKVDLAVHLLGMMEVPESQRGRGRVLAGFEAAVTIDRRDFGIGTGSWAETTVLGSEVEITIAVEARLP